MFSTNYHHFLMIITRDKRRKETKIKLKEDMKQMRKLKTQSPYWAAHVKHVGDIALRHPLWNLIING